MRKRNHETLVLAGDIGGTKTNLGLFRRGIRRPNAVVIESFPSREAPNLEKIIEGFLRKHPGPIASACFGIAGPVVNGRCKTTNLPWEVSEARLMTRFKWSKVRLINDLVSTAHAVPILRSQELRPLNKAKSRGGQNLVLIAPGTGLGEALLVFHEGRYIPVSSEGGHVDFSPTNEEEASLWRFLRQRFGHVSVERILSGPGLANIYSWLKDSKHYREPEWLRNRLQKEDPGRVITESGLSGKDPLCREVLRIFVSILGATAGDLVLAAMATGGVYLGGGIPPKILSFLEKPRFLKAFTDKGRFSDLLRNIPVKVILNQRTALLGAARQAFELLR